MTQEEKELLLRELCTRLPYKVKVQIDFGEHCIKYGIDRYVDDTVICIWPETFEVGVNDEDQACDIEDVKPYLRPMSSMTAVEKKELFEAIDKDMNLLEETLDKKPLFIYRNSRYMGNSIHYELDFLISHHFDYKGLIPMGLALKAPKGMYNTKTE